MPHISLTDSEGMTAYTDGMRQALEESRSMAIPLTDGELAPLEDYQLALRHNAGEISPAQLEAEIQRRKDKALRDKWGDRSARLDQLTIFEMGELVTLGMITEAQEQRQMARNRRLADEMALHWMKHRTDLKPTPRTHDEELMLLEDKELWGLKGALVLAKKRGTIPDGDPDAFTLEEIEFEIESRRVHPMED